MKTTEDVAAHDAQEEESSGGTEIQPSDPSKPSSAFTSITHCVLGYDK
jgi:hypothetical protein